MINFTGLPHMPQQERGYVIDMFNQLLSATSHYSQLQFLYNNNQHYSTASSYQNLCTYSILFNIATIATRGPNHINVYGTIHTNNHRSNLLVNENGESLFAEDTYIRISFWNTPLTYMHILMRPPRITIPYQTQIFFNYSNLCDYLVTIIPPIISYRTNPVTTATNLGTGRLPILHRLEIIKPEPKQASPKPESKPKSISPKPASKPKSKSASPKPKSKSASPKPKSKPASPKSASPKSASPKSASPKSAKSASSKKRNRRKRRTQSKR